MARQRSPFLSSGLVCLSTYYFHPSLAHPLSACFPFCLPPSFHSHTTLVSRLSPYNTRFLLSHICVFLIDILPPSVNHSLPPLLTYSLPHLFVRPFFPPYFLSHLHVMLVLLPPFPPSHPHPIAPSYPAARASQQEIRGAADD